MADKTEQPPSFQSYISFKDDNFQFLGREKFDLSQVTTMPVVHFVDGQPQPLGTCFVIANNGLALTARHVVDEAFGLDYSKDPNVNAPDNEAICAIYASNEIDLDTGHFVGGPLPIVKIYGNSMVDIAILQLRVPTNTRTGKKLYLPAQQLSPGVPKIGQHIFGFGYHSMSWSTTEDGFTADQRYSASRGVIQKVHFPYRDTVFMSFPCFETSARFDGGMSGGPIISDSGQVCGVICSSMKTDESDGTFTSYGSLIAPALSFVLRGIDGKGGIERDIFLDDFVTGGAVPVDHTYGEIKIRKDEHEIIVDLGEGRTFKNAISSARKMNERA